MALKHFREVVPPELAATIDAHARAVVAGDTDGAEACVGNSAIEAHRAAIARIASMRPVLRFTVIARARMGLQYIVKVRFEGAAGAVTMQNRWGQGDDGVWRIVEVEDLGLRSPWTKPDKPKAVNADA
jgi:hypothetical protein